MYIVRENPRPFEKFVFQYPDPSIFGWESPGTISTGVDRVITRGWSVLPLLAQMRVPIKGARIARRCSIVSSVFMVVFYCVLYWVYSANDVVEGCLTTQGL